MAPFQSQAQHSFLSSLSLMTTALVIPCEEERGSFFPIPLFAFGLQNGPDLTVFLRRPLVGFSDSSLSMGRRHAKEEFSGFVVHKLKWNWQYRRLLTRARPVRLPMCFQQQTKKCGNRRAGTFCKPSLHIMMPSGHRQTSMLMICELAN